MTSINIKNAGATFIYLWKKELDMSPAGWIFAGLLIISPLYEAAETKDESAKSKSRTTRSIMNLGNMVEAVTGRSGEDFVSYGNYCGIGGEGQPVDPIDECCQNHDICYDLARDGVCRDYGSKSVYQLEYKWRVADDETAVCDFQNEKDPCKMTICMCDAIITNCLKSNIDFYDSNKKKDLSIIDMLEGLDAISP